MKRLLSQLGRLLSGFVTWQIERPVWILVIAVAITLPAILAARKLGLKTDFAELLPDNKPSVIEMRRVGERLTSASTLTMVVSVPEPNPRALEQFASAVVPRIQALGPRWVGAVDSGNRESHAFLEQNKLLYAPLDEIRKVHDEIRERYDYEVQKRAGGDLGLDDNAPPPLTAKTVRERFAQAEEKLAKRGSGYYMSADGKVLAILIRTPVEPGSIEPARALREQIARVVKEVDPPKFDPQIRVEYTGDFITSVEEYESVKNDLGHVGLYGVAMVLTAVLLFFLRIRTLLAMGITIAIGLSWTFGAAKLLVGYLNSSTGFLVSIIAGNGINFGIIYMARFMEARRQPGTTAATAVRVAHAETWLATLAAAGAAMLSYGSLAITNFRGFKHFGVIGGAGMILCWLATYAFLPTILLTMERIRPISHKRDSSRARIRELYSSAFAYLAQRFPRAITATGLAVGVVALFVSIRYFSNDPMEYDMTKLRNAETSHVSRARELSGQVDEFVGRLGQEGMAIMVDRLDQVVPLKTELERRLNAAPPDAKPFEQVVTIFDVLPHDQAEKIPLLNETRELLTRAHARGAISEADWQELQPYLPHGDLKMLGIADLPEAMARAFAEKDGTRGRIVYIAPKEGRSVWDGHYLQLWADSFRNIELPSGEVIHGSGRAVIFADMLKAVVEDAPKAIVASLLGTLLVVLIAFGMSRASLWVLGSLTLGVVCMISFLAAKQLKLNFLNFVALPITFGIGVDYAVNIVQRVRRDGTADMRRVVTETGGAVILCSLTTTLGYLSLMLSMNQAIVTFGLAAAAGEVTCLVAAVLVLPAALVWSSRRNAQSGRVTGVAA
jgi:predicted RND superfamily exporter protein